jgi:hypothetical protein
MRRNDVTYPAKTALPPISHGKSKRSRNYAVFGVSPAVPRKNKIAYTKPPVVENFLVSETLGWPMTTAW